MSSNSWIDIHCHLDRLEGGPEAALRLAQENGVGRIITIGTEPEDLQTVLALAKKFKNEVFCTLGIHPHEGVKYTSTVGDFILKHAPEPEVVAVGEIGLDYYYNQSPKKEQLDAFEAQLVLAEKLKLPVEIHTRDADEDTIDMLKKFNGRVNGVIHCFTGTDWLARQSLDLGYNISISGIVTFKNAQSIRDTVKNTIPLDRIHVETDSPFLAPVPMRGKPNTSAFMVHTAKVVAELKGVSIDELKDQTNNNALKMFKKLNTND